MSFSSTTNFYFQELAHCEGSLYSRRKKWPCISFKANCLFVIGAMRLSASTNHSCIASFDFYHESQSNMHGLPPCLKRTTILFGEIISAAVWRTFSYLWALLEKVRLTSEQNISWELEQSDSSPGAHLETNKSFRVYIFESQNCPCLVNFHCLMKGALSFAQTLVGLSRFYSTWIPLNRILNRPN